jgi:hypothetical protein
VRHELRPSMTTNTSTWQTETTDDDLTSAAREHPTVDAWLDALASLGEATMVDNNDQQLYAQAPDALRRRSIERTPEAIERWVDEMRASPT